LIRESFSFCFTETEPDDGDTGGGGDDSGGDDGGFPACVSASSCFVEPTETEETPECSWFDALFECAEGTPLCQGEGEEDGLDWLASKRCACHSDCDDQEPCVQACMWPVMEAEEAGNRLDCPIYTTLTECIAAGCSDEVRTPPSFPTLHLY
jgi:hypothetical protein